VSLSLVDKVVAVADALDAAAVPYAFGGALALAYATEEPRGTRDIDVNVFVLPDAVDVVFAALPPGVVATTADRQAVLTDEQVRLWWDDTPVDVFFAADPYHFDAGERARRVDFIGRSIRVLAAEDLAVFKLLFDRPRDWVDVETMLESGTLDIDVTVARATGLLGDDDRVERLRRLGSGQ